MKNIDDRICDISHYTQYDITMIIHAHLVTSYTISDSTSMIYTIPISIIIDIHYISV